MELPLILAIVLAAGFAALAIVAFLKHRSVRQEFDAVVDGAKQRLTDAENGLLAKLHALENGGHLASGTTQSVAVAQIRATVPNGGQPASTILAPTT